MIAAAFSPSLSLVSAHCAAFCAHQTQPLVFNSNGEHVEILFKIPWKWRKHATNHNMGMKRIQNKHVSPKAYKIHIIYVLKHENLFMTIIYYIVYVLKKSEKRQWQSSPPNVFLSMQEKSKISAIPSHPNIYWNCSRILPLKHVLLTYSTEW